MTLDNFIGSLSYSFFYWWTKLWKSMSVFFKTVWIRVWILDDGFRWITTGIIPIHHSHLRYKNGLDWTEFFSNSNDDRELGLFRYRYIIFWITVLGSLSIIYYYNNSDTEWIIIISMDHILFNSIQFKPHHPPTSLSDHPSHPKN